MTKSEYIAFLLLPVGFASTFLKAPLPAIALLVAWAANWAYTKGIVHDESIRWISALVGACGAIEFGSGALRTKHRKPVSIPDAFRKVDAAAWIGLCVLASMGVDGFGMIVWRLCEVWIVPEATIGILCLVIGLGLFGKEIEG